MKDQLHLDCRMSSRDAMATSVADASRRRSTFATLLSARRPTFVPRDNVGPIGATGTPGPTGRRRASHSREAPTTASEIEKKLNEYLEDGNSGEFIALLEEHRDPDFDVNKRDSSGRTLLTRAIRLQNDDVVDALIDLDAKGLFCRVGGLKLDDAITHAIKETRLNIVDALLEFAYRRGYIRHQKKKTGGIRSHAFKRRGFNEDKSKITGNLCPDCTSAEPDPGVEHLVNLEPMRKSRDFTADLIKNPLLQAAIMDTEELENMATVSRNYDIIFLLIRKGNFDLTHPDQIALHGDVDIDDSDDLSKCIRRLHFYRALCSPSYISLKAVDIICHTFTLSVRLQKLAFSEPEFNTEYEELRRKCETYSTSLLVQCRQKSEVDLLLKKNCDDVSTHRLTKFPYPRINRAIELDQKMFVIHPACLKNMEAIWLQEPASKQARRFKMRGLWHYLSTTIFLGIHTILIPLTSIIIIVEDSMEKLNQDQEEDEEEENRWGQSVSKGFQPSRRPASRQLSEFLKFFKKTLNNPRVKCIRQTGAYSIFLFLLFLEVIKDKGKRNTVKYDRLPDKTEYLIMVYIMGFVLQEIRLLRRMGWKHYSDDFWNIYFLVTCFLFISAYVTFFVGMGVIRTEWYNSGIDDQTKKHYDYHNENHIEYERYEMWDNNYILITEAIFSFATILAYARVMQIFQLHKTLGPLQLTIIRIASVVGYFLVFFFIFMFCITCGIHLIYINYANEWSVFKNAMTGRIECIEQSDKFSSITNTFSTLFSALFGLGDADDPDVVKRNLLLGDKHAHQLTTADRRELCDSGSLSYSELEALIKKMNLTDDDFKPAKPVPSESLGYLIFGFYQVVAVIMLLNLLIAIMNSVWEEIKLHCDILWKFNQTSFTLRFYDNTLAVPPPFNLVAIVVSGLIKLVLLLRTCSSKRRENADGDAEKGRRFSERKAHRCTASEEYKDLQQELHQRYMISKAEEKLFKGKVTPELLNTVTEFLLREIHHCTELVLSVNDDQCEDEEEEIIRSYACTPRFSSRPSMFSWDQKWNPGSLASVTRTKMLGRGWSEKGKDKTLKRQAQKFDDEIETNLSSTPTSPPSPQNTTISRTPPTTISPHFIRKPSKLPTTSTLKEEVDNEGDDVAACDGIDNAAFDDTPLDSVCYENDADVRGQESGDDGHHDDEHDDVEFHEDEKKISTGDEEYHDQANSMLSETSV